MLEGRSRTGNLFVGWEHYFHNKSVYDSPHSNQAVHGPTYITPINWWFSGTNGEKHQPPNDEAAARYDWPPTHNGVEACGTQYRIEATNVILLRADLGQKNICLCIGTSTSSTAQGGGGSFKNRKPIGEVGCCESGMAERSHWWTERCLISLYLSLSLSVFFSLSLFFSMFLYLSLIIYLPTYWSICLSIYLSVCLSLSPSIYLPTHLSSCLVF